MNMIEHEAFKFDFFKGTYFPTTKELQDRLESKLSIFEIKKDRLSFLSILRKKVVHKKQKHKNDSDFIQCINSGLFLIDQKIEVISHSYEYQPKYDDKFNAEQKSQLHNSLNEIKEELKKQGFGQEVIFNELEELKEYLNLGKKNWFQLLKGKLFDLSVSKALDETVIKEVYKKLINGFENFPNLIDKTL